MSIIYNIALVFGIPVAYYIGETVREKIVYNKEVRIVDGIVLQYN